MCQFKTDWNEEEEAIIDFHKIVDNLSELQTDGLVVIDDRSIEVTEKGRPFVRNISMAFDLKLHRKKPDTRIFSMTV
jgi:oxygen-independent coproporphyrinogen-3 oxidase